MFKNLFSQDLKEGEEVVKIVRKHWASFFMPALKIFLVLAIPFFLIPFLFSSTVGIIIFFILFSVGLGYAFHKWINWYFDIFILTNQRIINIDQRSIFSRQVSETSYKNIQGVVYEVAGFLAMIFDYGSVKIQAIGIKDMIVINSTPNPKELHELILDLQQKIVGEEEVSAKELIDFISQAKENDKNIFKKNIKNSEKLQNFEEEKKLDSKNIEKDNKFKKEAYFKSKQI